MGKEQEFVPFADQGEQISMTEELSFIDLLKPAPHHLHIYSDLRDTFAACDCGWVGHPFGTHRAAAESYQAHIERPE